jgi:hypothetical protein
MMMRWITGCLSVSTSWACCTDAPPSWRRAAAVGSCWRSARRGLARPLCSVSSARRCRAVSRCCGARATRCSPRDRSDRCWSRQPSLAVLLARRAQAGGFLLVLTYRSDQLHRDHPLRIVLGELPSRSTVTRLELQGLSREAVGALAARSGLNAVELFDRTAGNPFYVTETLAAGSAPVPETVRDAYTRAWRGCRPRPARCWTRSRSCPNAPRCGCSRPLRTGARCPRRVLALGRPAGGGRRGCLPP